MLRVLLITRAGTDPNQISAILQTEGIKIIQRLVHPDKINGAKSVDAVLVQPNATDKEHTEELIADWHRLQLPVLAILDQSDMNDALSPNIDDFLVMPPSPGELITRIQQARMQFQDKSTDNTIVLGNLRIDPDRYEVTIEGNRLLLTYKEYKLLTLLATNQGRVYSREALLSQVWDYDYFGGTRTVDVHIRRLRSKISDASHAYIETIWNVGYRFRVSHR